MKIGMVTEFYYPRPGGISEHVRSLSLELTRRGHEVIVLTGGRPEVSTEVGPKVIRLGRDFPLAYNGSISRVTVGVRLGATLRRILEQERFDLLHIHNPLMPTLPLLALRHASCPVVATLHSNYPRDRLIELFGHPLRRLLRKVSILIPVSLTAYRAVGRFFPGDYRIIPNGVDYDLFARAASQRGVPELLSARGRKWRLLFVGALVKRKGLPVLIRAFTRLRGRRDDVELLIAGDGPQRKAALRSVPSRLRDDVRFFGAATRTDVVSCCSWADVLCAPSLGRESFGMILLEAMAAGLPIVASDIEGYRDVLTHGQEGLLVPPGDAEALAEALDALLENPEERLEYGRRGQEKAAGYRWRDIAWKVDNVYREVVQVPERRHDERFLYRESVTPVPVAGESQRT